MNRDISERYIKLVLGYCNNPLEKTLANVADLGKECVEKNIPMEDMAEMHESALARLVENQPDISLKEANQKVSVLYMELFMAYGLAARNQAQQGQLAMDELKISNEKLHTITDMANDAIVMMNSVGLVTYWNTAAERIFGYTKKEMINKDLHEIIVPEEYLAAFTKGFKKFKQTGKGAAIGTTLELTGIRNGGEHFPVELSLSSVKIGGEWNAIGLIRDISVRKLADDKLKESHNKYRLLAEQLEETNSMKELLLDIITHDLKNPMGNIQNAAQVLMEDLSENEMLEIIQDSCAVLLDVMKNTTALAQVGMGDKIETIDLDLVTIINEISKEFSSQLERSKMTLELNLPNTLVINANSIIAEIPKNFISNAIKYASEGKRIIVETEIADHEITLLVKDFGKTIPKDERERVFTRRVQLAKGERRGSGLGLAIVNRIANAHNAVVGVKPNDPQGNVFYLRIPSAGVHLKKIIKP